MRFSRAGLIRLVLVVGSVAALEVACRTGAIPRLTMIPPSEMVTKLWDVLQSGEMTGDILFTLKNLVSAILLSVFGGVLIGTMLHALPRLRHAVDPLLSAYYSVPTFVFYPLLIVMLGIGSASLIMMGALFGIVAMIMNTLIGLDRVPQSTLKTANVMRLGWFRSTIFLRLPSAAPNLMAGLKLAVAYSMIGIVAGEFILSTEGLGKNISYSYNNFDNPQMYALLLLLLIFVVVTNVSVYLWEQRLRKRWTRS
jgi:NitT/TauT family transport system permease protein